MEKKRYTISAFTENSPGVLQRITITFTKRKVNIASLTACETERKGISRFTIVVWVEDDVITTIVKQLNRIVEVQEVYAHRDEDLVFKEIAFIRVSTVDDEARVKVEALGERYGAKIVFADSESVILEQTGKLDEILSFYEVLKPYGIEEFVQSGRIALAKKREANIQGHDQE